MVQLLLVGHFTPWKTRMRIYIYFCAYAVLAVCHTHTHLKVYYAVLFGTHYTYKVRYSYMRLYIQSGKSTKGSALQCFSLSKI